MIKLYIPKSDTKKWQGIFKFFFQEECELCLFPEGLRWRKCDKTIDGIIYKNAFVDYNFTHRQKLGIANSDTKKMKDWFSKWKTIDGLITEITFK